MAFGKVRAADLSEVLVRSVANSRILPTQVSHGSCCLRGKVARIPATLAFLGAFDADQGLLIYFADRGGP